MVITDCDQKVQLLAGQFSPSEAGDLVEAFIDQKINFYKIKKLQAWARNQSNNIESLDEKIKALSAERQEAKKVIAEARKMGMNLHINCNIDISLTA